MQVMLVPHEVGDTFAEVWVGVFAATGRPPAAVIEATESGGAAAKQVNVAPAHWSPVDAGKRIPIAEVTAWTAMVTITGLASGRRYGVRCALPGSEGTCTVRTLPPDLPTGSDRPFTIWLGSCFAHYQDESGAAGDNYRRLPSDFAPDLKILCGDQVYLDNPATQIVPKDPAELGQFFLDKYTRTWAQGLEADRGFSHLLSEGATWFLADDHEFWNNHPNWSPLLHTHGGDEDRRRWEDVAKSLYQSFQGWPARDPRDVRTFSVGPVEFLLLDTRFGREPGDEKFTAPASLEAAVAWLVGGAPDTVGVLVLGAPMFTKRKGVIKAWIADRSLANYSQYATLADAILASPRSLLVLAGDIHAGRLATAQLSSGAALVEVTSSPLALVSNAAKGSVKPPPPRFPVEAGALPRCIVNPVQWIDGDVGLAEEHFTTLGFAKTDQSVSVRISAWGIEETSPRSPRLRGSRDFTFLRRSS